MDRQVTAGPRLWATLTFWLLATLLAPASHAAGRVALLIGNKDYEHQSNLLTPLNDINLMEQTLVAQGFKVEKLPNQYKKGMERAIQRFVSQSQAADVAMFYYAGHGQQPYKGGRNYLLPTDAKIGSDDDLETEAVLADDIVRKLEGAGKPARLRLVILDACRNNPKGWLVRADRGLAPIQTGDQYTLVGFSTNERAPALDSIDNSAHSPYAQALAKWFDRVGELPVRRIFDETATDVRRRTAERQQPRISGDLPGDVLLTGSMVEDDVRAWAVARESNSIRAIDEFLRIYPKSRFASEAKIRIAALRDTPGKIDDSSNSKASGKQSSPTSKTTRDGLAGKISDFTNEIIAEAKSAGGNSGDMANSTISGEGAIAIINGHKFEIKGGSLWWNGARLNGFDPPSLTRIFDISIDSDDNVTIKSDQQTFSYSGKKNIK